jgi:hypothetical protein
VASTFLVDGDTRAWLACPRLLGAPLHPRSTSARLICARGLVRESVASMGSAWDDVMTMVRDNKKRPQGCPNLFSALLFYAENR